MKFAEILEDSGIPYLSEGDHHCTAGWLQFECPFCGKGSGKHHMGYHLSAGYVNCWKCGYHNLAHTVAVLTNSMFMQAVRLLERVDHEQSRPKLIGKYTPPTSSLLSQPHDKYLRRRRLDPMEMMRLWNLQGIGLHSTLSWRILIPIYYQGKAVSWSTRSIGKASPKYVSASPSEEAMNHRELLYGEDYCRHAIIIHEGPADVWQTGPGSVALFGTGYSAAQMAKIARYPIRVICLDNEPQAQQRARRLTDELSPFPGETYNVRLDAKDAGEASPAEIQELRKFLE